VIVGVPVSVAGSLDHVTKRGGEDRDEFRRRVESALAEFGRDYARRVAEDDDLRRVAVRDGRWEQAVAGDELYRFRELLR
jgi:3-oxoacyl-ACP reductase-like protein